MPVASNQEIYRLLGELTADVKGLRRDVESFDRRNELAQQQAAQHRSAIHKEVAELGERMDAVENRLTAAQETLADTKAVTDEVKLWKQRGIGAIAFAGLAGTSLGAGALYLIGKALDLWRQ